MGKYARGKHAVLIDDRSGWKIKYKDARTEWTGFRVYKGDWEPKQPQLDPEMYIEGGDPSVLYKPRPPQNTSDTIVQLGSLYGKWSGQCAANLGRVSATQPADAPSGFQMNSVLNATGIAIAIVLPVTSPGVATSALGTVTIAAVEDAVGFEATSSLGSVVEKLIQPVTGFVGTTGLGTVIVDLAEEAAGFAGTTTLGSITINVAETVSGIELGAMTSALGNTGIYYNSIEIPPGLAGTGGLGTLILNAAHPVTGFEGTTVLGSAQAELITAVPVTMSAMTAYLGTASITSPSWGTLTWGRDTWGE
tara:strand:- start:359 stop:1276 length:918 start_codon:yes stop_codon:yes gene_type:complete